MTEKPNLSVEEVARWLGVDARTVYRLVKRGKLPGFKVGNQWRFGRDMLEAWVAEQVRRRNSGLKTKRRTPTTGRNTNE